MGTCARKHVVPARRRRRGDLCLAAGQIGLALVLVLVLASVLALVLGPAVDLVSASRQLSPWKKITAGNVNGSEIRLSHIPPSTLCVGGKSQAGGSHCDSLVSWL